jgi:cation diffusion facilitator family transporter
MAEAWHHRSDALSSVGSFVGILGARLGLPLLDPIASAVICLFILKAAADIFRDAVGKMTDKACGDETLEALRAVITAQSAVLGIDSLQTRLFGDKIYVDVEISMDGALTLTAAHDTAQRVHDAIETRFPTVKHCMVHVNPAEPGQ